MRHKWPVRSHFIIFFLLSLIATAQLTWWIIFQVQEGTRVTRIQRELWRQQIAAADERALRYRSAEADEFRAWLAQTFPDLESGARGEIRVRVEALQRLDRVARERMRMFISEGIFFSVLLGLGVIYMYWIMRREIINERRQAIFLSATSHELKTPITSLRLYLETLMERELNPVQRWQLLQTMRKDLFRLTDLIERLLQAQAMLSRKQTVELRRINLTEETNAVLDEVVVRFDLKGFQMRSRLEPDLHATAHSERWQVVVRNLLENAFKYSPEGGVVTVSLTRKARLALLEVEDEGIGFNPAEAARIFERFYRIGRADAPRTRGTGLGLYLVREIAESFGGKAYAWSAGEGRGARFTVVVPLAEDKTHG